MDILLIILSAVCLLAGMVGCVVPALPGPPIAYLGLLLLHCTDQVQFSPVELWIWLAIVIFVQALDSVIPTLGTKYSDGSKWGTWGAFFGSIIGLFFLPWGLILGPFFGAIAGEMMNTHDLEKALKSGFGSVVGFLLGTIIKLILCAYFIIQFCKALWM